MSLASYRLFIFNFEHMLHNVLCVHCCLEQVNTGCAVKKLCRPTAMAHSDKKKCVMTFNCIQVQLKREDI